MDKKLERDSCQKCINLKGKLNSLGKQMYCSQAHAYEENTNAKYKRIEDLKKEIFETVYQWGRTGVIADSDAPVYRKMVNDLEETWY